MHSRIVEQDIRAIVDELVGLLQHLSGSTLLVTGGSGFLCSYFLDTVTYLNDHVWRHACRMICVDNLKSSHAARIAHLLPRRDFLFIQHDISNPLSFEERIDWIVHGASIASPTAYRRFPLETIEVNTQGTKNILELARKSRVRSMLYLSTSEVYGDPDPKCVPTSEEYCGNVSCTGPRACYDESKRLGETLCTVYNRLYDTPVKIVRPFNVYGPGLRLDDGRIIPDLMSAALERQPIVLYSDGRATRAFCYITDAIRAMWYVLMSDANGEVFNIGNDQGEISIEKLAQCMQDVAGQPRLRIEYKVSTDPAYLTDNPQRRCPDLTKLRRKFPWKPDVPLQTGLRRTLESHREIVGKKE